MKFIFKIQIQLLVFNSLSNTEDARHFIFVCTKYQNERQSLLRSLGNFQPISLDTLLFGNDRFSSNDNITIQIALQKYIIDTKRFK